MKINFTSIKPFALCGLFLTYSSINTFGADNKKVNKKEKINKTKVDNHGQTSTSADNIKFTIEQHADSQKTMTLDMLALQNASINNQNLKNKIDSIQKTKIKKLKKLITNQ